MQLLTVDATNKRPPTRLHSHEQPLPKILPQANVTKTRHGVVDTQSGNDASLYFVGTATTILSWAGFVIMTDPNFLHAGDHVHLGPGVTGTRLTNPAINIESLPHIDAILLSHYHADHFDEKVENDLRRDLPIISTPHAHSHLTNKGDESFTNVHALDFWEDLQIKSVSTSADQDLVPIIQITGMPGSHVPPGILATANSYLQAVPPTNGWIVELGYDHNGSVSNGYRIYISGDTLLIDDLHKIPEMYSTHTGKAIDLMLIHLGGTTIPGPSMPLLMVTMDAEMGVKLMQIINADVTIPIHFDDYDVFLSPRKDFEAEVDRMGLSDKVVYLDRGDEFKFQVRRPSKE